MSSISKKFGDWVEKKKIGGLDGHGKRAFYVSERDLREYWEEYRIRDVWGKAGEQPPIMVTSIVNNYLRIFSTLVFIAKPNLPSLAYFDKFERQNIDDNHLPYYHLEHASSATNTIFPNTPEGIEVAQAFSHAQFLFTPVIFQPKLLHKRELDDRCVLPLTFKQQLSGGWGDSAVIKTYEPHEASKLDVEENLIVIKEYPECELDRNFKNELKAYMSFQNIGDESNVSEYFLKYYGSFIQNRKGYILLEYANEGSLLDFFRRDGLRLPYTGEELHGLWKNLSNLLIGLKIFHAQGPRTTNNQLRGVHQDLKPANIFVFRERVKDSYSYRFKIGDFGLTSVSIQDGNAITSPDNKGGTMYSAPEVTNRHKDLWSVDAGITDQADIWSFACILFETGVWAICGERGREEFRKLRSEEIDRLPWLRAQGYGASFHDGLCRLDAVDKMLKLILGRRRVFDDLTEPICMVLLNRALLPRQQPRDNAGELWSVLEYILQNSQIQQRPSAVLPSSHDSVNISSSDGYQQSGQGHAERASGVQRTQSLNTGRNPFARRSIVPGSPYSDVSTDHFRRIEYLPGVTENANDIPLLGIPYLSSPVLGRKTPYPPPINGEQSSSNGDMIPASFPKMTNKDKIVPPRSADWISNKSTRPHKADYPEVKVQGVIKWIEDGKRPELRGWVKAQKELKKREQIFIIDDSTSMIKNHWPIVVDTFKALAHLASEVDPNGIELYFTSKPGDQNKPSWNSRIGLGRDPTKWLIGLVAEREIKGEAGGCHMERSLSKVLERVKKNLSSRNKPETSVYILTDGVWDDPLDSNVCGVDNPIRSLAKEIQNKNLMRPHISLQFIQFGDNPTSKSRFRYLDDDLGKELKFDIVDSTTHRSSVWKMLLGSIISAIDNSDDDDEFHDSPTETFPAQEIQEMG